MKKYLNTLLANQQELSQESNKVPIHSWKSMIIDKQISKVRLGIDETEQLILYKLSIN